MIRKLNFIKIKNFYSLKGTIKKSEKTSHSLGVGGLKIQYI